MDEMRGEIARANIQRYEHLLEKETNAAKRATLESLLAEARSEALLVTAERALEQPGKDTPDFLRDARRWWMKAEECRTIADACHSDAARHAYLNLARSYEALAERAQVKAGGQSDAAPKAG